MADNRGVLSRRSLGRSRTCHAEAFGEVGSRRRSSSAVACPSSVAGYCGGRATEDGKTGNKMGPRVYPWGSISLSSVISAISFRRHVCPRSAFALAESQIRAASAFALRAMADRSADKLAKYRKMTMIGKTLSHYRITQQLGKGGMGEVYQAEVMQFSRYR